MTRTISFIIGITVLALVAIPTALGEGRLAGSSPQDAVTYFRANELATLVQQPIQLDRHTDAWNRTAPVSQLGTYPDAGKRVGVFEHGIGVVVATKQPQWLKAEMVRSRGLNKMYGLGEFLQTSPATYKEASERVVESPAVRAERLRSEALDKQYGLGDYAGSTTSKDANDSPTGPVVEPVSNSGTDIQWPQLGIGLGIGIALAFGLMLMFRTRNQPPLAH